MNPAIQKAVAAIVAELQKADAAGLSKGGMKVEVEAGGEPGAPMEECAACAEGTCEDPEHLPEEDAAGLADMYAE